MSTEYATPSMNGTVVRDESPSSPFADHELANGSASPSPPTFETLSSPFSDSFETETSVSNESEIDNLLHGELEDEDFADSLEALAAEASRRYMSGSSGWHQEAQIPTLDSTDLESWISGIGDEADQLLAELERHFADRPVESVSDDELDSMLGPAWSLQEFVDPLDAREMFFGGLKKKLKKVAKAAKNVVKKGIKLASKVMPLGIIYGRLRKIIRPLLRRVLGRAIGRLPRSLQEPARRLARRYGLRPSREVGEFEDSLVEEFDEAIAEAVVGSDDGMASFSSWSEDETPSVTDELDAARERLAQQLLSAESGYEPIDEIEQFAPAAILPIVRTGIKLIGRRKVVNFVAGLLARLIKPVVGRQLARPLSVQIADKGLAMLSLEAESSSGRLAAEAAVATIEETLAEVFDAPEELLESEAYLEHAVEDAFHRAAARNFPASFLRRGVGTSDEPGGDGVWVMMPRTTAPIYRYRKYSRPIPVRVGRQMAREVVFSDGETLEDRLADAGEEEWPVDVEIDAYELLPASDIGHLAAFEGDLESASLAEVLDEFDTFEEIGPLPLPASVRNRRRPRRRRVVRLRTRRGRLRKRRPVGVELDASGAGPSVRMHVRLGERRALKVADAVAQRRRRDVVGTFRSVTGQGVRAVVGRRLGRLFERHGIDGVDASAVTERLLDLTTAALADQLGSLGAVLTSAAQDPARGITITAAFDFASKEALAAGDPPAPTISIRPGRHRG